MMSTSIGANIGDASCRVLIVAVLTFFLGPFALAEERGWSNQGLIYLLGPTLEGTTGIGPIDTQMEMTTSDVFDALDGAFLGMYRGEGERWGILVDVVHMDLKVDGSGDRGALSGEVGVTQTTAITSVTWRVSPTFQLMGGALYNDISARVSLTGPFETRQQRTSEDWIDPIVGFLWEPPISDSWTFTGSMQVGGFEVGSDLVTILTGSFSYRFNAWASIDLGYRYLNFDYEDGDGVDRFKFDMKEHGPAVGFRFDF